MAQNKTGRPAFADPTRTRSAADHTKPIDRLLLRLEGVRRTGPGRWIARCPAHDDRAPSLSVRELGDSRVLLYCFSGCSVHEVLSAVGLSLGDLYPDRPRPPGPGEPHRERRPFDAIQLLHLASFEGLIVAAYAGRLLTGHEPTPEETARVIEAAVRLNEIAGVAHA